MRLEDSTAALLRDLAAEEAVSLVVAGECMLPELAPGDRIRVRRRRIYWPGDVVAFRRSDGRLLVHRVLGYLPRRGGWSLVARGDHLSREDEPVGREAVIGRVLERNGEATRIGIGWRLRSASRLARMLLRRTLKPWVSATSS